MKIFTPAREYLEAFSSSSPVSWKSPLPLLDKVELFLFRMFLVVCTRIAPVVYIETRSEIDPKLLAVATLLKRAGICEDISYSYDEVSGYHRAIALKTISYDLNIKKLHSNGVDKDKNIAFSKALGEIVERVVGGVLDQNRRIHKKSLEEINSQYYNPSAVHHYTQQQKETFPWLCVDPRKEIEWVEGESLVTKDKVFIPRSLTSWHKKSSKENEYLISATTNGSAGYFTREGAVLRGLFEVVERDGFLVHWLSKIAPPSVVIESLPQSLTKQVNEVRQEGDIYILDTMTEVGVPSVVIVLIQKSGAKESVSMSGASRLTYAEAIEDALKEMVPCARYSRKFFVEEEVEFKKMDAYTADLGKEGRVKWWVGENRRKHIAWFLEGEQHSFLSCEKRNLVDGNTSDSKGLKLVTDKLVALGKGYMPWVYYPKHEALHQVGFCVAQVFVVQLFPMYLVEYLGTFESERLKEFASYKKTTFTTANTTPHPMS